MDDLPTKTKTGNLDFHLAAAGCYVPVMMLNYILPVVFLATEPREHQQVRFHAVQSLFVSGLWILSTVVLGIASFVLPVGFMMLGSVLGMEDVFFSLGILLQLVSTLALFAVLFVGLAGLVGLAVLTGMEKDPRIPVLAVFAQRFAGEPA